MRVLAFDPGYERLGVAVLEKNNPSTSLGTGKEELLFSDCVRTKAALPFEERLAMLGAAAEALIKKWRPDAVALEEVYFEKNAKTAMQVARVAGVLAYLAAKAGLPVHQYTPMEVKVATTGHGGSDKRAIAAMLPRLVSIKPGARLDDEMDAIAVGITCLASVR